MPPISIELKPNRSLLDSNFDGYKLSLEEIPKFIKNFETPVDRVLLDSSQYTLLHAKLFGLHNCLIGDPFDENDSVYFVDSELNLCKSYIDTFSSNELIQPTPVFKIPENRERLTGDCNVTLKFVSNDLAVLSDGKGKFYILNTGTRNDDDSFTILYCDEVIFDDNKTFIISDAVLIDNSEKTLHVVLLNIQKDTKDEEKFVNVIHWITFSEKPDKTWGQIALRQLKTKGHIEYLYLERSCEAIYVVSEDKCEFTLNSEHPIVVENKTQEPKQYSWTQNLEEITIKYPLSENSNKELVKVTSSDNLEITYNNKTLISGKLHQNIDTDLTTWTLDNNLLEIMLTKSENGIWPELIVGDQRGEYILDTCIVEQVHERFEHLCNENEALPQTGNTFNSQQIEECDFETDKSSIFERFCGKTNAVTHKVHLGSHQVLLTSNSDKNLPPSLGIRHDVDVCLWQPKINGDSFDIQHEGTLMAFGYVQASKQNRKFSVCPPDLSYSVICESTRHLFIYRQNKPVSSTELRNRTSGRRVRTIAQQQVVNVPNGEILGIYSTNKHLFLLGETFLLVLKL